MRCYEASRGWSFNQNIVIKAAAAAGGIGMGSERIIPQPANCGLGDLPPIPSICRLQSDCREYVIPRA